MGGAIGAVMLAGSMKTLQLSLETSQVARSTLSEAEFRHIINQFFTDKDKCLANFKPKTPVPTASPYSIGLYGDNREWGVGEVFKLDSAIPLEKGGDFKGDLKIVKMELKGDLPTTSPPDGDKITKKEATRHFIVYYKKRGLGSYSTVGGADCKANNLSGCYFNRCVLTLKLEPNPPDTKEEKCESTCTAVSGGGGGSGNPDCYKVDDSKTLVGCGDTKDITATATTAIGNNAGQALTPTGTGNTFLGSGAGYKTTTGQSNIFIGFGAGQDNTEGSDNTFIGTNPAQGTVSTGSNNIAIGSGVKVDNPDNDNQINIGNIIKAKKFDDTDKDGTTIKRGVIEVCNADGNKCIKLSRKDLTCGENEYFRGFDDNGEKICDPVCPEQSKYHWKQENICHKCPRDSPVYKTSLPEGPRCEECPKSKPFYLLNTKQCRSRCSHWQVAGLYSIDHICRCPSSHPVFTPLLCEICPPYHNYILRRNACEEDCPDDRPHFYAWDCHRCPINKPVDKKGPPATCSACPGDSNYNFFKKICENNCPTGQVAVNYICQCPTKEYPYYTGSACVNCTGGKVWKSALRECRCPSDSHWDGSNCITCTGGQVWQVNGCRCPGGSHWNGSNCITCTGGQVWQVNGCRCPGGSHWNGSSCTCADVKVWRDNACRCPQGRPHEYGGRCNRCAENQRYSTRRSGCVRCGWGGYSWDSFSLRCKCSSGILGLWGRHCSEKRDSCVCCRRPCYEYDSGSHRCMSTGECGR